MARRGTQEIPFPETKEFVDNVLETREVYARAYADELGLDEDSDAPEEPEPSQIGPTLETE